MLILLHKHLHVKYKGQKKRLGKNYKTWNSLLRSILLPEVQAKDQEFKDTMGSTRHPLPGGKKNPTKQKTKHHHHHQW